MSPRTACICICVVIIITGITKSMQHINTPVFADQQKSTLISSEQVLGAVKINAAKSRITSFGTGTQVTHCWYLARFQFRINKIFISCDVKMKMCKVFQRCLILFFLLAVIQYTDLKPDNTSYNYMVQI